MNMGTAETVEVNDWNVRVLDGLFIQIFNEIQGVRFRGHFFFACSPSFAGSCIWLITQRKNLIKFHRFYRVCVSG